MRENYDKTTFIAIRIHAYNVINRIILYEK